MKTRFLSTAFLFICLIFSTLAIAQVNTSDSLALVSFFRSTNGTSWKSSNNWLTQKPVAKWRGVEVTNNRVTKLQLHFNGVGGVLPDSIGYLTALNTLDLSTNRIKGSIPASMGNMTSLVKLYLNQNNMSGYVPGTLGKLSNVQLFNLAENAFTGLSDSLGQLTSVTYLWLYGNHFSGVIPSWIGQLKNLNLLWLYNNNFSGNIPAFIWKLNKLTNLDISRCQLTGHLSNNIGNLKDLANFNCSENNLSGPLPPSFGSLPLQRVYFNNNQFSGSIPSNWSNATTLLYLVLNNNNLSGAIPSSFGNLSNLTGLQLGYSNLSGELPAAIGRLPNLGLLNIESNHITTSMNFKLPPVTALYNVNFTNNNFTFNGLEAIERRVATSYYAPQAQIKLHKRNNTLAVTAGGTLANNIYNWHNATDGTVIAIKGDSVFHPTVSGKYYATITNTIAKDLTLYTDTVSYKAVAAVIAASPNPVVNVLRVSGLSATANMLITISDISGNIRMSTMSNHCEILQLDVSTLKAGNYILNAGDGNTKQSLQFIKQ